MLRRSLLVLYILLGVTSGHFAMAQNISKTGNLTATAFDELGFDTTGLVGYWQLNGNAQDSSGLHNDGTIYGATATTDRFGTANMALNFNGTSDRVAVPNFMGSTTTFTVCHWVYLNANQNTRTIFSNYSTNGNGWVTGIKDGENNRLKFYLGGAIHLYANTIFAINTWYHVVVTYNNGNPTIYIDGAFDATSANTITFSASYFGNDIGRLGNGAQYFNGKIDEVKVFSRALSAAEILAMYNHEKGKFSVTSNGTNRALSFVEDPALPVQMRSKKESLTVQGSLIEN